ncbi:LamB/YcsF family protein [Jatrophihabitans endophyticus]|uniref:LamB/YcsF family protein n=1 Tax=Jatrophihabitans endophyticus TaxID=1206085 RepID=UPI0019DCB9E8|nr:5-oxoprolinase subunit PxpA [Jatrophihabitans endophyticus]MBE7189031.1 LamB/YcsF family protein [Jatrophihabitans endophyticus]
MAIDLNADLGEGFGVWRLGDDDALLPLVTSANVACGFHAGDPLTMRRVCAAAAEHEVAIGAQVSYRDLAGFGRRRMDVAPDDLAADVLYQLGALEACARAAGSRVRYVKPHGALYNTAADDDGQAAAVVAAVVAFDASLPLLALPGSAMERAAAAAGLTFVPEAFADRAYLASGRLAPRGSDGAVLSDEASVVERARRFALEGTVEAADGTVLTVSPRSICLHGDTPGAVAFARAVRAALEDAGVELRAFTA